MAAMRRPACHAAFSSLALLAMLLLAIVPTAGRIAGGGHAMHAMPVATDAPAPVAHGDAHHAMGHHGAAAHHAAPAPPIPVPPVPAAPHDGDCEYCPLLSGLVAFALPPVALDAIDATVLVPAPPRATAPRDLLVPGLGARGPPTSDA